jgi:hypothetical protein
MTENELSNEIAAWEEDFNYHLRNYHTAREMGSFNSAENSRKQLAEAAAILTELRSRGL